MATRHERVVRCIPFLAGMEGCMVDALASKSDEGRVMAAISFGEVPINLRSEDVRMGKPHQLR
jgi:hypothetical protein